MSIDLSTRRQCTSPRTLHSNRTCHDSLRGRLFVQKCWKSTVRDVKTPKPSICPFTTALRVQFVPIFADLFVHQVTSSNSSRSIHDNGGKVILLVMPTRRWKELVCFFLADFMGSIGRLKLKKDYQRKTVLNDCHLEGKPTWTVGGATRRKIITIEYKWLREINQVEMKMHAIWK